MKFYVNCLTRALLYVKWTRHYNVILVIILLTLFIFLLETMHLQMHIHAPCVHVKSMWETYSWKIAMQSFFQV